MSHIAALTIEVNSPEYLAALEATRALLAQVEGLHARGAHDAAHEAERTARETLMGLVEGTPYASMQHVAAALGFLTVYLTPIEGPATTSLIQAAIEHLDLEIAKQ